MKISALSSKATKQVKKLAYILPCDYILSALRSPLNREYLYNEQTSAILYN